MPDAFAPPGFPAPPTVINNAAAEPPREVGGPAGLEPPKPVTEESTVLASLDDGEDSGLEGLDGADSLDLMTVAGMAHFASNFVDRFGMERLESLLTVSEHLGRIGPERKDLVLTLGQLFSGGDGSVPTARGIVALLAQLDGLAGSTTPEDVRVLPYLLYDDALVDTLLTGNGLTGGSSARSGGKTINGTGRNKSNGNGNGVSAASNGRQRD